MTVHQLPALTDNYIYILHDQKTTIVIDPAESGQVIDFCHRNNCKVDHILLTHHHPDHIGGVPQLAQKYGAQIWGFAGDKHRLPPLSHPLQDGSSFKIDGIAFEARHTPGHTLGHICYFLPEHKYLFCGDVLFSMGCGRLFEGTAEMSLPNFRWMRALPPETTVFCAHEYTKTNTEFVLSIDSENKKLNTFYKDVVEKRKNKISTVPFPLSQEIELNPFLRWDDKELRQNLDLEEASDVDVFHEIRRRRNQW